MKVNLPKPTGKENKVIKRKFNLLNTAIKFHKAKAEIMPAVILLLILKGKKLNEFLKESPTSPPPKGREIALNIEEEKDEADLRDSHHHSEAFAEWDLSEEGSSSGSERALKKS